MTRTLFRPPLCRTGAWCWLIYHMPDRFTHKALAEAWGWPLARVQRFVEKLQTDNWIDVKAGRGGSHISLGIAAPMPKHGSGHRDKTDVIADVPKEPLLLDGDLFGDTPPSRPQAKQCRIPESWRPTVRMAKWAEAKGFTQAQVVAEARKFFDHWRQATGKSAIKKDWDAAFRTWITKASEWRAQKETPGGEGALDEIREKYGR